MALYQLNATLMAGLSAAIKVAIYQASIRTNFKRPDTPLLIET